MLVLRDRLLSALGCNMEKTTTPFPCPMHPHTEPSLSDITDSGVSIFSCTHCKFNGDAIALVTKARGLKSPSAAMQLFLPGNELSHTLQSALSETQLQGYLNGQHSQVLIREYIQRCHAALSTAAGQRLISELTRDRCAYRKIPDTLGVMCTDRTPPGLHKLEQSIYKSDIFGIFAYEYGNSITAVAIRAAHTDLKETIPLVPEDKGVYLASSLPENPEYLIVAQDEVVATDLYARGEFHTATGFPMAVVRGYPLPNKYRTLKHIYLLSTGDAPLTLANAVKAFAAHTVIAGTPYRPGMSVLATSSPTIEPTMLVNIRNNAVRIEHWIAQELLQQHIQYGMPSTYRLMQSLPSFGEQAKVVISLLQQLEAPAELITCVEKHHAVYDKRVILSSSVCVYRTPTCYMAAGNIAEEPTVQISNFTFTVTQVLYQLEPLQVYYRTVIKPAYGPSLTMLLPNCAFRSGQFLHRSILGGYLEAGYLTPPNIVCSARRDISWLEIRDMFNDNLPEPVTAIDTLGVSPQLTLELPNLTIAEHGTKINIQTKILKPDPGMSIYSGIRPFQWRYEHLQPFATLWETPTIASSALAACLSQLVFCIISSLAHHKVALKMSKQHLLLTDTSLRTWRDTLRQFIQIIGNSKQVPIAHGGVKRWFAQYEALGDLPLPFELPDRSYKISPQHILGAANHNWLASVGGDFAEAVNDYDNVVYLSLPDDAESRNIPTLAASDIVELQSALPEFLQCVINQAWDIPVDTYAASLNPTLDTYKFIGDMLDVVVPDTIYSLLHTEYRAPSPKLLVMPLLRNKAKIGLG